MTKTELMDAHKFHNDPDNILAAGHRYRAGDIHRVRSTTLDALLALATVYDIVSGVEDTLGNPGEPCSDQSRIAVKSIRERLGIVKEAEEEPPKKVVSEKSHGPSCGSGPYTASIVTVRDGKQVWKSEVKFSTEAEAQQAIIKEAYRFGHRLTEYTRHWVTKKKEHIIDYGSYSFYGRIVSARKRSKGKGRR